MSLHWHRTNNPEQCKRVLDLQYIARIMHRLAICCVLSLINTDRFYPYSSGLLHWHRGNHINAPVLVKQTWKIWIKKLQPRQNKAQQNRPVCYGTYCIHDDVIKCKHFPRYWPFVRGIHRSPVNSPHKGLWRGALMCSLICARINGWVNNGDRGWWFETPSSPLWRHCNVMMMDFYAATS